MKVTGSRNQVPIAMGQSQATIGCSCANARTGRPVGRWASLRWVLLHAQTQRTVRPSSHAGERADAFSDDCRRRPAVTWLRCSGSTCSRAEAKLTDQAQRTGPGETGRRGRHASLGPRTETERRTWAGRTHFISCHRSLMFILPP